MNVFSINEAKAIIEPYYNNGELAYSLKEHPILKEYVFKKYNENISIKTTWCSLNINIKKGNPKKAFVSMERDCNLNLCYHDEFILFASISKNVLIDFEVIVDGKIKRILENKRGFDTTQELVIPFIGNKITHIKFTFKIIDDMNSNIDLRWLGVSNSQKESLIKENKAIVDSTWPMCIKEEVDEIKPSFDLYFDNDELKKIRENINKEPFKSNFNKMRKMAKEFLTLDPKTAQIHIHTTMQKKKEKKDMIPENMISKYVPWGDRRWNLDSEMDFSRIDTQMEILSFVGIIDENIEMCKMAARMALSIAHCEHWTESPMGSLPGVTWHHRSFTEVAYLRACSIVLDWVGFLLTPYGQDIILDALVMKGLPRVESDFKRFEYIRHMNQGIHFNGGRLHAYLVLSKVWPRYKEMVVQCKTDLYEMINNYVKDDGGTLEGPAYWNYTFSQAIQEVFLLTKSNNENLEDVKLEKLFKTGDYGINMLSILNNGTMLLPINDAHFEKTYHLGMAATFFLLNKNEQWKKLYFRMLKSINVDPDPFLFIVGSKIENDLNSNNDMDDWFNVLYETGQVDLRVTEKDLGMIHFHYLSGPIFDGHYHGDKSSFIFEINDESMLIDRGVTPYSHPETMNMKLTKNHNCLVPYDKDNNLYNQPLNVIGGKLIEATYNTKLKVLSDSTNSWDNGVMKKMTREIISNNKMEYIITDKGEVGNEIKGLSFRLHTHKKVVKDIDGFTILGDKCKIKIIPMNYSISDSGCEKDGIDSESRDVNTIWINNEVNKKYEMITKLIIRRN